ncbi:hypothetical protein NKH86_27705 [Mesorhizobium sp. M0913]|uniref:hypothetical protein n=1 Tax=Mesorhizobium sp. M0913 TaxID=2957026 RepID=UPI003336D49E
MLEKIGQSMELGHTDYGPHWFRRYAAFWGPVEQFVYLDARQITLGNIEVFFDALNVGFDIVYADAALNQVYEAGELRNEFLRAGGARGFISNAWASRRGVFDIEQLVTLSREVAINRRQLNARNTDQAFINYCCDAQRLKMARLADVMGDLCQSGWARNTGRIYRDGSGLARLWDHGGLDHRKKVLLVHWAGLPFELSGPKGNLLMKYTNLGKRQVAIQLLYEIRRKPIKMLRSRRTANNLFNRVKQWILHGKA